MKVDEAIEKLYEERTKRIKTAAELGKPDRVPVIFSLSYFPARFADVKTSDAYYNFDKWKDAYIAAVKYLEPDRCGMTGSSSGYVLETMGARQSKWPGHGASENHSHQAVEMENMKADEYDLFLEDTADFMIRYVMPRTYEALEPLDKLPPLYSAPGGIPYALLASPEYTQMFEKLMKAGQYWLERQEQLKVLAKELYELGYGESGMIGAGGGAPFDMISDFLRGMRGAMLDMHRQPDKLLEAIELQSKRQLRRINALPQAKEFSLSFIALHRGADGFMSNKQFEKFYWPYLLKSIKALIEKGYTPNIFFEGDYTSRLEYLLEIPKGKVVGRFDCSDTNKLKEIIHGHMCISGVFPSSLLTAGTPQQVKDYCKWIIDYFGKDGGFIMTPGSSVDEAKPENLKTMVDFTKEYGRY
jgi:uroporphyrinogen-III decarboxylase